MQRQAETKPGLSTVVRCGSRSGLICVAVLAVAASGGCKKKSPQASTPLDSTATAAQNPNPGGQAQTDAAAPVFTASSIPQVQAAIKAKDYDKAAAMLITLQRAPMNGEQSMAVLNQMRQFQKDVAMGVASGDANAKAAAARLRQSSLHQ